MIHKALLWILECPLWYHELNARWIVDGAMDGNAFDTYVETQLAPTLGKGDVVILDNLNAHKSPRAQQALAEHGAWLRRV